METKKTDFAKLKSWFNSLPAKRKYEIHQMTLITYNSCSIEGSSLSKNETFNVIARELFKQESNKEV